jgi:hypothetical protein
VPPAEFRRRHSLLTVEKTRKAGRVAEAERVSNPGDVEIGIGQYEQKLQQTDLEYLLSSEKALGSLAENYVGLPF